MPGEENAYFYEPRGVTVVIAPWNFPLAILTGMTTAPLVTGNPVIMKPAEQSSVVGGNWSSSKTLFQAVPRQLICAYRDWLLVVVPGNTVAERFTVGNLKSEI